MADTADGTSACDEKPCAFWGKAVDRAISGSQSLAHGASRSFATVEMQVTSATLRAGSSTRGLRFAQTALLRMTLHCCANLTIQGQSLSLAGVITNQHGEVVVLGFRPRLDRRDDQVGGLLG